MEWINIKDKKPEPGKPVWYYFDVFNRIYDGHYYGTDKEDVFYGKHGFLTNDVTFWMPKNNNKKPDKPSKELLNV